MVITSLWVGAFIVGISITMLAYTMATNVRSQWLRHVGAWIALAIGIVAAIVTIGIVRPYFVALV